MKPGGGIDGQPIDFVGTKKKAARTVELFVPGGQ
jgi:hypothetical protein